MNKNEYITLWKTKPWEIAEYFYQSIEKADLIKLPSVDIDYQQFINFSLENFDYADQDFEREKSYHSKKCNLLAKTNVILGYSEHNTFVLNYGKQGNTNSALKMIFGDVNMDLLNLDPESVLMRLIVKFPGNGFACHIDDASSYKEKFNTSDTSKIKRIWIPISPWEDGHMFQISKSVITHWKSGDVFEIPWGIPHLGVNFGVKPQFTLNITGAYND
jgi:hypothetical protein